MRIVTVQIEKTHHFRFWFAMASQLNLDEILQEDDFYGLCGESEEQQSSSEKLPMREVSLQDVQSTCMKMATCCPFASGEEVFKEVTGSDILKAVSFLNKCLVPRGRLAGPTREKAWAKFMQSVVTHIGPLSELTKSPQIAMWLCLRLFENMLEQNYPIKSVEPPQPEDVSQGDLSEEVKDIVYYIGGSIVQKLKQRWLRLKNTDQKEDKLQCLELFSQEEDDDSRMTKTLNRGGLLFLKQTPKEFFILLEVQCSTVLKTERSGNFRDDFISLCCQDAEVLSAFNNITAECEVDDCKECVLKSVLRLYFKIRVHHECKKKMEQHRSSTTVSAKGLRKGLKTSCTK